MGFMTNLVGVVDFRDKGRLKEPKKAYVGNNISCYHCVVNTGIFYRRNYILTEP